MCTHFILLARLDLVAKCVPSCFNSSLNFNNYSKRTKQWNTKSMWGYLLSSWHKCRTQINDDMVNLLLVLVLQATFSSMTQVNCRSVDRVLGEESPSNDANSNKPASQCMDVTVIGKQPQF